MERIGILTLPNGQLSTSRISRLPRLVSRGLLASGTYGEPGTTPAVLLIEAGAGPVLALPLHGFFHFVGMCLCAEVH